MDSQGGYSSDIIVSNMQTTLVSNIDKKWPAGSWAEKYDVAPRRSQGVDDSSRPEEIVSGSGVFAVILPCASAVVCGIYGGRKRWLYFYNPDAQVNISIYW